MNYSDVATGAIILAVVVVVIYRQLGSRQLSTNPYKLPVVLAAIGLFQMTDYLNSHPTVLVGEAAGAVAGLVFAAAVAVPRARSMTVYRRADGTWMRRGGVRTLGWWIISAGGHVVAALGVPFLFGEHGSLSSGPERSTLLLYLAVTLGTQSVILHQWMQSAHIVKGSTSGIGDHPGSTPRHP